MSKRATTYNADTYFNKLMAEIEDDIGAFSLGISCSSLDGIWRANIIMAASDPGFGTGETISGAIIAAWHDAKGTES